MSRNVERKFLAQLILENEDWLMERILGYAASHDYTRYTSTLKEAWRASISGLSTSIIKALKDHQDIPEFGPDEDWFADACGEFGRVEAELHRDRGITLAMFLALMKYYRQCYLDLLHHHPLPKLDTAWCELFIHRVFDRVEISFSADWQKRSESDLTRNLQQKNRQLANEKNKYLTMFESSSLPCMFIDSAGKLDSMNLPAARLFQAALNSGEHYFRPQKDEHIPQALAVEIQQFIAGETEECQFEKHFSQSEQGQDFLVMCKRMLDVSNKFSGVIVSMADIRAQKELERAHADLKAAQAQLLQREKMASIGQLAAGVAHEINNPIGFIKSNLSSLAKFVAKLTTSLQCCTEHITEHADLKSNEALQSILQDRKLPQIIEDIPDLIDESLDGVERVNKIVQNLKTFSRIDSQEHSHCDLNESLESALNIVWSELKYKATVEKDYGELPKLLCFPHQLSQAFLNLLVNAGHAIGEAGEIHLKTWQEEEQLCVSISDNGCGMSEETQKRLFEPFYTTKPIGQGTGLGMSIVYDIVQQHKGTIEVESALGQGSRFTIRLPLQEIPGE
ncbi:ATP-binding protein [uncultured Desulfuromonas sp.]|uniref:sensor histidine kinase n=1 Tax=uncultured Desulfuromonas sp. TaxID=181013 RepID=UPI002AAA837A|nr:ATP-binding protein [uncultured Desulfuromonas sp.]